MDNYLLKILETKILSLNNLINSQLTYGSFAMANKNKKIRRKIFELIKLLKNE